MPWTSWSWLLTQIRSTQFSKSKQKSICDSQEWPKFPLQPCQKYCWIARYLQMGSWHHSCSKMSPCTCGCGQFSGQMIGKCQTLGHKDVAMSLNSSGSHFQPGEGQWNLMEECLGKRTTFNKRTCSMRWGGSKLVVTGKSCTKRKQVRTTCKCTYMIKCAHLFASLQGQCTNTLFQAHWHTTCRYKSFDCLLSKAPHSIFLQLAVTQLVPPNK